MASDRIFGLVVLCVALAFIASAFQIQTSFLTDPVGSKSFPILVGSIAAICALAIILRPDPEPGWPGVRTFGALAVAVAVLVAYAYALVPFGFIVPTLIATSVLSFQIRPKLLPAVLTGAGLSIGLFVLFRFVLGLGLLAFPRGWFA